MTKPKPGRQTTGLTVPIHARLTPAQHRKFLALGGSSWLRKALDADGQSAEYWERMARDEAVRIAKSQLRRLSK